jgi:hypothetical protein
MVINIWGMTIVLIFASDLKSFGTRSSFNNTQGEYKHINSWILPLVLSIVHYILLSKFSFEYIIEKLHPYRSKADKDNGNCQQ